MAVQVGSVEDRQRRRRREKTVSGAGEQNGADWPRKTANDFSSEF
jgi:hypothetical protein